MTSKATAKKTTRSKAPSHKAKSAKAKPKVSWAETMKSALEKRQPAGGPKQPKPRGSGVQPVRKNAF